VPRAAWLSSRRTPPSLTATQVALQFVTDIEAGARPSIETALDQVPLNDWADLLRSLLIAEVNARRARGEAPTARDYLPRFPAHTDVVRAVLSEVPARAPKPPPLPGRSPLLAGPTSEDIERPVEQVRVAPRRPQRRRWLIGIAVLIVAATAGSAPFLVPSRPNPTEGPPSPPAHPVFSGPATKGPQKVVPKAAPADPERVLAEWIVAIGGRGMLLPDGASRRPFSADAPLPKRRFAVTAIVLPPEAAGRWTPDDLERLRGRDKLSTLEIHTKTNLSEANLAVLVGSPVRGLDLDAPVRAAGKFFASFPALESLALPHAPEFLDADLAALSELGNLSALAVDSPNLTLDGFQELKSSSLKSLVLGPSVSVTPDHIRVLQRLSLEEFECATEVTDDTFIEFALFPEMRRIRLRHAPVTDSALRAVAGLGKLEEFRAGGASVTGPGLVHLEERNGLRVLDLSGAKLTNGVLGPLLGLPELKELRLAGNPITDDGAVILAQLDGIEILDLGETGVTDAALRALSKHLTLKTLIVTNTRVTAAGVRDFETRTPGCKVITGKRD
jgi:hypothetical protein